MKALDQFHPAVRDWFLKQFPAPTEPQAEAWPAIKASKHTLIAAPTGSGKTLAAFLSAIDDLVWKAVEGTLTDETHVVYVSPLKALSNDIKINLEEPLKDIQINLEAAGVKGVGIRTLVRTGDTPAKDRAGNPLNVPVAAARRDDPDGSRWLTAQLALAPLAPGDYVIEIASGDARSIAAFRVVP